MNNPFVSWKRILPILFLFLFSSNCFGSAGEVLEVNGREIIIEGDGHSSEGDELVIYDYDNKRVARVKIGRVVRTEHSLEYICETVTGDSDIRVGFMSRSPAGYRGSWFLEFGKLNTKVRHNPQYNLGSGSIPSLEYGETYIVRVGAYYYGESFLGKNFYASLSMSYMDIGPYCIWDIIEFGIMRRLSLKSGTAYVSFGALVGVGINNDKLKWARPADTYEDNIGRDSGEVKQSVIVPFQGWTSLTYNLSSRIGFQFKAGYFVFLSEFSDTEKPSDLADAESGSWDIEDDWLEVDVENHGMMMGMSILVNFY